MQVHKAACEKEGQAGQSLQSWTTQAGIYKERKSCFHSSRGKCHIQVPGNVVFNGKNILGTLS